MSACENVSNSVAGPFNNGDVVYFLGAPVISITENIGRGGLTEGTCTIRVTDQLTCTPQILFEAYDYTLNKIKEEYIWTPQTISISSDAGTHSYTGIIQRILISNDATSSKNIFEVTLVDATQLLDGVQVILGSYGSYTYDIKNLINVFGFYEQVSYGFSGSNTNGFYWNLPSSFGTVVIGVKRALELLTDPTLPLTQDEIDLGLSNAGVRGSMSYTSNFYGAPLKFRNIEYKLDFSEMFRLPDGSTFNIPSLYRVGGGATIAPLIQILVDLVADAGFELYLKMEKVTDTFVIIKPQTIYRKLNVSATDLGKIQEYVQNSSNYIMNNNAGLEANKEGAVASFILGSNMEELREVPEDDIYTFWGFDKEGNPLLGQDQEIQLKIKQEDRVGGNNNFEIKNLYKIQDNVFALNASELEGLLGDNDEYLYICSSMEFRFALMGMDMWLFWLTNIKPYSGYEQLINNSASVKETLPGLVSPWIFGDSLNYINGFSTKNTSLKMIQALALSACGNKDSEGYRALERIFRFVENAAMTMWGTSYLAIINGVQQKLDADSGKKIYSHSPINAGYPLYDAVQPLNITLTNRVLFENEDGRIVPFMQFAGNNSEPANLEKGSYYRQKEDTAGDYLFVMANTDSNFVEYERNGQKTYGVPIKLNGAVFLGDQENINYSNVSEFQQLLGVPDMKNMMRKLFSPSESFPFSVAPDVAKPTGCVVPLLNNIETYGPWYIKDPAINGRVFGEQNDQLTPWNYGGFSFMDAAANVQIAESLNLMQVIEAGSVTVAGMPTKSLGDILVDRTPTYITNISVDFGVGGVTTTYDLRMYSPRYGVFNAQAATRLREIGTAYMSMSRQMRLNDINNRKNVKPFNVFAMLRYNSKMISALHNRSPKSVLIATVYDHKNPNTLVEEQTVMGLCTLEEATTRMGIYYEDGEYNYEDYINTAAISLEALFRPYTSAPLYEGNKISRFIFPSYTILNNSAVQATNHIGLTGTTYTNIQRQYTGPFDRQIGFKGPLAMVGFGKDYFGKSIPNDNTIDIDEGQPFDYPNDSTSENFVGGYEYKPSTWIGGFVDLKWDKFRRVWASPGTVYVATITSTNIVPTDLNGKAYIGTTSNVVNVRSPLGTVKQNDKVVIAYDSYQDAWIVIAAACS